MTGRIWARMLALFKKSDLDRELDDEAQSHITLATDDYLQRGMSLPEAQRLARLRFGSIAASKDAHRASRGVAWLEGLSPLSLDNGCSSKLGRRSRYGLLTEQVDRAVFRYHKSEETTV